MSRKTVYIETSVPSAYVDRRDDVVSQFQRHQTRLWWRTERTGFAVHSSELVRLELENGSFPGKTLAIRLMDRLDSLPVTDEVIGVAKVYQEHLVMPRGEGGDAFHLALACVHEVDYLLTWNCRHLANTNKIQHIQAINLRLGLMTPVILTPPMLARE